MYRAVDKILKQQQHEKQVAEEARRSQYIGESTNVSAESTAIPTGPQAPRPPIGDKSSLPMPVPVPVPPQATRPNSGPPGGWGMGSPESSPMVPQEPQRVPPPTQKGGEGPLKQNQANQGPTSMSGPGPQALSNALQKFTRKLAGRALQGISQEISRVVQSQ